MSITEYFMLWTAGVTTFGAGLGAILTLKLIWFFEDLKKKD